VTTQLRPSAFGRRSAVRHPDEHVAVGGLVGEGGEAEAGGDGAVDARHAHHRDLVSQLLREHDGAFERGIGQQDQELLTAVAPRQIAVPQRGPEGRARGGQRLVALVVAVDVVDLLEVVEVAEDRRQGQVRAGCLRDHPDEVLPKAAGVREPRESVGRGPDLHNGEVPEVREHRRGLADRLVDPPLLGGAQRLLVRHEHGADHLAADERRHAGGPCLLPAEVAREQGLVVGRLGVGPAEADGEARARGGFDELARDGIRDGDRRGASSRFWLLLRFRTTISEPARERSR